MIIRTAKPAEMTSRERAAFIAFVSGAGEVGAATLPALVAQAAALVTLHDGPALVGTAAIKAPSDAHRCGEFRKAKAGGQADAYPLELGWVVVDPAYRRRGHARALVAAAMAAVPGQGVYATTKTGQMRKMLPEHGFAVQGEPYPSVLTPEVALTLFGRPSQAP